MALKYNRQGLLAVLREKQTAALAKEQERAEASRKAFDKAKIDWAEKATKVLNAAQKAVDKTAALSVEEVIEACTRGGGLNRYLIRQLFSLDVRFPSVDFADAIVVDDKASGELAVAIKHLELMTDDVVQINDSNHLAEIITRYV